MATTDRKLQYQCPGETQYISASVHLARLSAFYPACRTCEHRHDTGQIPAKTIEYLEEASSRVGRQSLLTLDGVRGIYLNELTRERAASYAAALAQLLWRDAPLTLGDCTKSAPVARLGPLVVAGFDERPSSPDIAVGVVRALRTMSCRVIDVGQVTRPGFSFAVDHLQAAAGIHITGAGRGPVWSGLDFVSAGAVPISAGDTLRDIERLSTNPLSRPSRQAGQLRAFHAAIPYEAGLWKHFHALRPLKVVCGTSSELVGGLLTRIFDKLPGELFLTKTPLRQRNMASPDVTDYGLLADEVRLHRAHLGILIDDDARTCGVLDERGEVIPHSKIAALLFRYLQTQHPRQCVVAADSLAAEFPEAITCEATDESISRTMSAQAAVCGADGGGRYWFRESYPTCDAVLTLARLLQLLSRSDAEFSRVVDSLQRSAVR